MVGVYLDEAKEEICTRLVNDLNVGVRYDKLVFHGLQPRSIMSDAYTRIAPCGRLTPVF